MNKNFSRPVRFSLYILFTLLISLSSCQKKFASFQAGSRENFEYHHIPRLKEQAPPVIEKIPARSQNPEDKEETLGSGGVPVYHIPAVEKTVREFRKKQPKTFFRADDHQKVTQKEKPKKKKKDKRKKPKFNDGLKTGTIFLLIAVVMGIFSLTQLTLLFGLVSVLFLYFGLKKYYRQQRRRNIFK